MCGVIGLINEKDTKKLGPVACRLLRMLEYRGYDSTGAAIQDSKGKITLKKDVGSPTNVTKALKIDKLSGHIFCGQVRWATFGSVTRENAQPHDVKCKTHIYGAHNGNITNCDQLKKWLISEGHAVVSDNDGEMLVHTVEHYFAAELARSRSNSAETRRKALKAAIIKAGSKMVGSYAAVVVDPVTGTMACIKAGSSLYMGQGFDDGLGHFVIASSDLSSVLSLSKILIPINENEFAIYSAKQARIYDIKNGEEFERRPIRSKLKIEETQLKKPYNYFMEQEIFAQADAARRIIGLYMQRSKFLKFIQDAYSKKTDLLKNIKHAVKSIAEITDISELKKSCESFIETKEIASLSALAAKKGLKAEPGEGFESSYSTFLDDMRAQLLTSETCLGSARHSRPSDGARVGKGATLASGKFDTALKLIDSIFLLDEVIDLDARVNHFVDMIVGAYQYGSSIYLLACGTSFHAAKTATTFFDKIAGMNVFPVLPGEFRAQYSNSLREKDVVIGISQSGETKDLIDIFNMVRSRRDREITLISIVNNANSSLALEKSDLYIPLFCGPEVAVPATKSFMNQLIVLYILALRVANRLAALGVKKIDEEKLAKFRENLFKIPDLIEKTFKSAVREAGSAAEKLFLEPSIHILATGMFGVAKEGALKIREVVLNHTEGFEGSEFKHGPNTILGVNTVFGMDAVRKVLEKSAKALSEAASSKEGRAMDAKGAGKLLSAISGFAFRDEAPRGLDKNEKAVFEKIFGQHNFFDSLYTNYPLVFITGPGNRDVNLTISQINTHKIRGTNVFVIAEENELLRDAVMKAPVNKYDAGYKNGYIVLPPTGDYILPVFTSTVVLQLLALKMSVLKMKFLDRLDIADHGVHPDSPKNVSKSITVD